MTFHLKGKLGGLSFYYTSLNNQAAGGLPMMHFHSSFTPVMSNEPLSVIYPSLQQFMFCNSLSFFFLFAFRA